MQGKHSEEMPFHHIKCQIKSICSLSKTKLTLMVLMIPEFKFDIMFFLFCFFSTCYLTNKILLLWEFSTPNLIDSVTRGLQPKLNHFNQTIHLLSNFFEEVLLYLIDLRKNYWTFFWSFKVLIKRDWISHIIL